MWANYRALGYRRMIYTNTASVLEEVISELAAAMGDNPQVTAVLLTCSDATAGQRLAQREAGSGLDLHIERSDLMARSLDRHAPAGVHRVTTDSQDLTNIAAEIIALTGRTNNHPEFGEDVIRSTWLSSRMSSVCRYLSSAARRCRG